MRAYLLFLVAAFDADTDGAPTDDPETEIALLDEYDDGSATQRFLGMVNVPNGTSPGVEIPAAPAAPAEGGSVPWGALALVGLTGAGAAGYFMTRPGFSYQAPDPDFAESGFLEEEYDLEYEGEYDEEYEE